MYAGPLQRSMTIVQFVTASCAVWRLTHLLVAEDGPWGVLEAIRRVARVAHLDRLVACFYCASVWVATAVALLLTRDWRVLVIVVPALSGAAILLERATAGGTAVTSWFEEKETT